MPYGAPRYRLIFWIAPLETWPSSAPFVAEIFLLLLLPLFLLFRLVVCNGYSSS
jgi:hypothetical protein